MTNWGISKNILAYSGISDISSHNQPYSRTIQAYYDPCVTLVYSELWYIKNPGILKTRGIYRTLVYPKLWHIQDPGLFRTLGYSKPETYSEPCQTSTMEHFGKQITAIIIFASYNYFCFISFSSPSVHETNLIF